MSIIEKNIFIFYSSSDMKHLSKHERNEIQILKEKGYSLRDVATVLARNVSTISRELKRNKVKGRYLAKKADFKAYQRWQRRKIQMKKIRYNDQLENYIREKLTLRRTPQLIAGARNKENPKEKIGYVSIYKYIYSRFGNGL